MGGYILITGATDGIGLKSAEKFAEMGKNLILHGRREERLSRVINSLKGRFPEVEFKGVVADFEDLHATHRAFEAIKDEPVSCLINNAGTFSKERRLTVDGFEVTYQVNHLAHFMITHQLLDVLKRSGNSSIIVVSSMAHADSVDFDALRQKRFPAGYDAYALSKLCNILFAFKMARMLEGCGISVNCIHPGVVNTKLLVQNWGACGMPVEEAYRMVLFAYSERSRVTGAYLKDFRLARAAAIAYDVRIQDECYRISSQHLMEAGIKI